MLLEEQYTMSVTFGGILMWQSHLSEIIPLVSHHPFESHDKGHPLFVPPFIMNKRKSLYQLIQACV